MMTSRGKAMIDCKTFHEQKLADPFCNEASVQEHAAACPSCARFASKLEGFERQLRSCAMGACEIPKDLAECIIARHCTVRPRGSLLAAIRQRLGGGGTSRGWFAPVLGALAMTLILGTAALVAFNVSSGSDPMARVVIAHVLSEPRIFSLRNQVSEGKISAAFARVGGTVEGSLGEVRHLGYCLMGGKLVHHLLLETPEGEATLILIPGEILDQDPHSEQGMTATLIPLSKGSVGIVARSEDITSKVRERVTRTVRVEG